MENQRDSPNVQKNQADNKGKADKKPQQQKKDQQKKSDEVKIIVLKYFFIGKK